MSHSRSGGLGPGSASSFLFVAAAGALAIALLAAVSSVAAPAGDERGARASAAGRVPVACRGPGRRTLRERLAMAALAAPEAAQDDGTLYGMQRWRPATGRTILGMRFPGLLSCAYTVSAIFRGACHPIGQLPTVRQVDEALAHWPKVTDPRALSAGDVVFWRPSARTPIGVKCPGHWHVGVSLGGALTVDNDWWSGKPIVNTIERSCRSFAHARRPPPGA
jgi:hypothetical protein